jgi:hypothetical protein
MIMKKLENIAKGIEAYFVGTRKELKSVPSEEGKTALALGGICELAISVASINALPDPVAYGVLAATLADYALRAGQIAFRERDYMETLPGVIGLAREGVQYVKAKGSEKSSSTI